MLNMFKEFGHLSGRKVLLRCYSFQARFWYSLCTTRRAKSAGLIAIQIFRGANK